MMQRMKSCASKLTVQIAGVRQKLVWNPLVNLNFYYFTAWNLTGIFKVHCALISNRFSNVRRCWNLAASQTYSLSDIPYFTTVIIMCTTCDKCGWKSNEVKSGGPIQEYGCKLNLALEEVIFTFLLKHKESPPIKTIVSLLCKGASSRWPKHLEYFMAWKWNLQLQEVDLARDLLKSDTCSMSIPELDLEVGPGALSGRFTTVEGLLIATKNQLTVSIVWIVLCEDNHRRTAQIDKHLSSAI